MKSQTTARFLCKPEDCYVSRHLEGPDYKILDLMRAAAPLTNGKRIFYASVRPWLCNAANQAASTVDATLLRLTEAGWLINLGRSRRADGTETPNSYEVVEHATWAAAHPGSCPDFKFAPNWDEANKYGVKKGERLKAAALPKNFWPDEPVLRSILDKITAEKAALVTDEEMSALNAHFTSLTAMSGQPELAFAMHGAPGLAEAAPPPVDRSWAMHGAPEQPPPVNRISQARPTVQNPSKPILVNQTDTHTPEPNSKNASVCVHTNPSAMEEQKTGDPQSWVAEVLAEQPREWSTGPKQRKELTEIAARLGQEMFLAVAKTFINEPPEIINSMTLAPWTFFAPNVEKYILRVKSNKAKKAKEEAERPAHEKAMRLFDRKKKAHVSKLPDFEEFLASLPQEDRDYRAQVEAATTVDELPPDNGKDYDDLRYKFMCKRLEEERATPFDPDISNW